MSLKKFLSESAEEMARKKQNELSELRRKIAIDCQNRPEVKKKKSKSMKEYHIKQNKKKEVNNSC